MDELIRILKAEELTCVVLQKQRLYKEHANGILPSCICWIRDICRVPSWLTKLLAKQQRC